VALVLGAIVFGALAFGVVSRTTGGFVVWSDGLPYFLYARSIVLNGDTNISDEYLTLLDRYGPDHPVLGPLRDWGKPDPVTGALNPPWPTGAGLVTAPFYGAGYIVEMVMARSRGAKLDSYGLVTQVSYAFGSVFYGLLGCWATFRICRTVETPRWALLSTLGVFCAGPAIFYVFFNPSMAHASSFGLVALFVMHSQRAWREHVPNQLFFILSLLLSLLVTIRYQNAIFGIVLAAVMLRQWSRQPSWLATRTVVACTVGGLCIPFLLVLLLSSGASATAGENAQISFDLSTSTLVISGYPLHLTAPYFWDVLVNCRHGAFYWAPVLALGAIGLTVLAFRDGWARLLGVTVLLQVYTIGALGLLGSPGEAYAGQPGEWETHWAGGTSFGMRYLTECAPIFALGLSGLIVRLRSRVGNILPIAVVCTLVTWNFGLIAAYGLQMISRSACVPPSDMFAGVLQIVPRALALLH
jgi:hypothetical protein